MKRILLSTFFLLAGIAASAQAPVGSWFGVLDAQGRSLTLVFNVSENGEGLECTMDSPDEGVNGLPATVSADGLNITFEVRNYGIKYEGINTGKMISGTFSQRGMSFPLVLKYGRPVFARPQEPKLPLPYDCQEVVVNNGDIELHGTLTLPETKDMVIVMVTGSGSQNRDEELFNHKPFFVISDRLAREGISTFRYDDRGVGYSTGDSGTITVESNTEDALSAVRHFKDLGYKKVGLLGHSEGGLIAFILASRDEVDFIISLAGPAVDGESILIDQYKTTLKQSGYTDDQIQQALPQLAGTIRQQAATNPWMESFLPLDPGDAIKSISCPVLALNGDKDVQVRSSINLSLIKELLGGKGNLTAIEYNGLNHLFQHSIDEGATEYNKIEETISEQVLDDITEWVKTFTR